MDVDVDEAQMTTYLEILDGLAVGNGLSWAVERLRAVVPAPEVADAVVARYLEAMGEVSFERTALTAEGLDQWYEERKPQNMVRWSYARDHLGLDAAAVEQIDRSSDEIVSLLSDPAAVDITTRGLVLGYVQSGKTTSFLSVAAKAADCGYNLVIILAGVHNTLRRQTQDRAVRTLVHSRDLWWLGTAVGEFYDDGNSAQSHLSGNGRRGLLVVKKNVHVLRRLNDWLDGETDADRRRLRILVIDDEADQAGLDVGDGSTPQGIHEQMLRLVNFRTSDDHRRCAYLAYTATPYANILTNQDWEDLYPRDFIVPLRKPAPYVGAQELFGTEAVGRPVIPVDDEDDEATMPDSLRDAVSWFVVATAARAALRGSIDDFHSSMLVHTTSRVHEQQEYVEPIQRHLESLRGEEGSGFPSLAEIYTSTLHRVPPTFVVAGEEKTEAVAGWSEVRALLPEVLRRLVERQEAAPEFVEDGKSQVPRSGIIVDNGSVHSRDRLTYSDLGDAATESGVFALVIGGNTLSRGLTLEGLVSSYFARTSPSYDTLMQMGRWFGFRNGYRHLVRIWTTRELMGWFLELTHVEEDLRAELEWMIEEGFTPDRYGPRIRTSTNMNITRQAAMRSVGIEPAFSDDRVEPGWLDLDPEVLASNREAVLAMVADLPEGSVSRSEPGTNRIARDVPHAVVARFLERYSFHGMENRVDVASLRRHIDRHADALSEWTVLFKSLDNGGAPFDFGGAVGEVVSVRRSRFADPEVAYIGSLVDSNDHRIDRGGAKAEGFRYRGPDEQPLLAIYAIDPVSEPAARSEGRVPLDAPEHPIGVSLTLPFRDGAVGRVRPNVRNQVEEVRDDR